MDYAILKGVRSIIISDKEYYLFIFKKYLEIFREVRNFKDI